MIVRIVARKGGIEVLKALKNSELGWKDLMEASKQNSHTLSARTKDLISAGLIKEELASDPESPRKRKVYTITDTGRRILELLEEIGRVHKEGFGEDKELKEMEEDLEGANEPK